MPLQLAVFVLLRLVSQHGFVPDSHAKEATLFVAANPLLRVCLMREFGQARQLSIEVPAFTRITCDGRTFRMSVPRTWLAAITVSPSALGTGHRVSLRAGEVLYEGTRFLLEPPPDAPPIRLAKPNSNQPRRYRGAIELTVAPSSDKAHAPQLRAINILPLEGYLRGVIAMEMPPSAPPAALAAQAICARTHALKSRVRYQAQGYDVVDTTACQVYGGLDAERAATDAAVLATEGLVLMREGQLIWGDYYDACGGVTAAGEREGDYPPSVVDAPQEGGPPFCAQGAYHTWEWTLSADDLMQRLAPVQRERLGNIVDIIIVETDASGRARRVRLEGTHGMEEMAGSRFRALLGYDRLRSTFFTVSRGEGGIFLFKGRGNGHGHGLCQRGAMAMAGPPYNHSMEQILKHYYPGVEIVLYRPKESAYGGR